MEKEVEATALENVASNIEHELTNAGATGKMASISEAMANSGMATFSCAVNSGRR